MRRVYLYLFLSFFAAQLSQSARLADALGWHEDESAGCCGGWYEPEPSFFKPTPGQSTKITYDHGELQQNGPAHLHGHVVLEQPNVQLTAEDATVDTNAEQNKIEHIHLRRGIRYFVPGHMLYAENAHVYRLPHRIELDSVLYRQALGHRPLVGWGEAAHASQGERDIWDLRSCSYTTCPPHRITWQVQARRLRLNKETGYGKAYHAWLKIHGLPVFYFPYLQFPIDERRLSGFLTPAFGRSSSGGTDITLPYYFNVAPNQDFTLVPRSMSERGILWGGTYRFLTPQQEGSLYAAFLPHDRTFATFKERARKEFAGRMFLDRLLARDSHRLAFSFIDTLQLHKDLRARVHWNWLSDDYFFDDFGFDPRFVNNQQVPQTVDILYSQPTWNMTTSIQKYQTIERVYADALLFPYDKLPAIDLNFRGDAPYGLEWTSEQQLVNFTRKQAPFEPLAPIKSLRMHFEPTLSWPEQESFGFIVPSLRLYASHYELRQGTLASHRALNRLIPAFFVRSGLYFEREPLPQVLPFLQTLEPQIQFLTIPYQPQSSLPFFDTGLPPFDVNQVFAINRFSGKDRVGDTTQLSLGLTSRCIEPNEGLERLKLGLGQIFYFRDRRIPACIDGNCKPLLYVPNDLTNRWSPIAASANFLVFDHLSAVADMNWDLRHHLSYHRNIGLHYVKDQQHILNLDYTLLRNGIPFPTSLLGIDSTILNKLLYRGCSNSNLGGSRLGAYDKISATALDKTIL